MDTFSFVNTLKLEKSKCLVTLIITEIFCSIKKTEESFTFFLLNAVYRKYPVTMRK